MDTRGCYFECLFHYSHQPFNAHDDGECQDNAGDCAALVRVDAYGRAFVPKAQARGDVGDARHDCANDRAPSLHVNARARVSRSSVTKYRPASERRPTGMRR